MEMNKKLKIMEKRIIDTKREYKRVLNGLSFISERVTVTVEEKELLKKAYELLGKIEEDIMFEYEGKNELLEEGNVQEFKAEPHTYL